MKKTIRTKNYSEVSNVCQDMGDKLATTFHGSGNIKAALAAGSMYRTMIAIDKTLLLSKKQTGKPEDDIDGLQN